MISTPELRSMRKPSKRRISRMRKLKPMLETRLQEFWLRV